MFDNILPQFAAAYVGAAAIITAVVTVISVI